MFNFFTDADFTECIVEKEGDLASRSSVHIPDVAIESLKHDKEDIQWGLNQDIDMVFVSSTENAEQIENIRKILGTKYFYVQFVFNFQIQWFRIHTI